MEKVAKFIVKYRYVFAILILALAISCIFTIKLVEVEESVAEYLPDDTNTKKALKIMKEEFVTYGSTTIMVKDISLDDANKLKGEIAQIDGVKSVAFNGDDKDYKNERALIEVTFKGDSLDEVSLNAYEAVIKHLEPYNMVIPTPLYTDLAGRLQHDVTIVLGLCAVIILIILLLTSRSYAEVIVFPFVFIFAAWTNMGTNFWFGKISFVSNTVCVILQLALAIDYSIILCHRFNDEKLVCTDSKEAMVKALSKAIPEILSSCLTTVSGLLALVTMNLKLGQDLGLVLAKSILFSIFIVILLMPTLLLWVSKLMDKSRHKSFVPPFKGWTKAILKSRKVLPIVFLCLVIIFGAVSSQIDFAYAINNIDTNKPTDVQVAIKEREETFGYDNVLVVLVPKTDYKNEKAIIDVATSHKEVTEVLGISNIEFGGTYLVDELNYKELATMLDMEPVILKFVYTNYAKEHGIEFKGEETRVRVIDMAMYLMEYAKSIHYPMDEKMEMVAGLLQDAKDQLIGTNYTRVLLNIDFPVDGKEVFAFTDMLEREFKDIDEGIIFAGEAMSSHDLSNSFETDMFIISILTGLFVFIILLFTFKSWALPIALVAVIQGAILINFGIVPILGRNFYFFVYLIVSAIQMGATIDYAIIVTNHYREERKVKPKDVAIYDAMSASFPAIITSGTIMVIAPLFVGIFISDPLVSSLGYCLARGSFISILSVLTVLPELLYTFERAFLKSTFRYGKKDKKLVFVSDDAEVVVDANMSQDTNNHVAVEGDNLEGVSQDTNSNESVASDDEIKVQDTETKTDDAEKLATETDAEDTENIATDTNADDAVNVATDTKSDSDDSCE